MSKRGEREEENYRIVEEEDRTFTIELSKKYLETLREGKHTFAISLLSLDHELNFEVEIVYGNFYKGMGKFK